MNDSTVYVGMDVHKETFSLCCYTNEKVQAEFPQKFDGHYSKIINYIEAMRFHYGDDALFICGYEAGCLGFAASHPRLLRKSRLQSETESSFFSSPTPMKPALVESALPADPCFLILLFADQTYPHLFFLSFLKTASDHFLLKSISAAYFPRIFIRFSFALSFP